MFRTVEERKEVQGKLRSFEGKYTSNKENSWYTSSYSLSLGISNESLLSFHSNNRRWWWRVERQRCCGENLWQRGSAAEDLDSRHSSLHDVSGCLRGWQGIRWELMRQARNPLRRWLFRLRRPHLLRALPSPSLHSLLPRLWTNWERASLDVMRLDSIKYNFIVPDIWQNSRKK